MLEIFYSCLGAWIKDLKNYDAKRGVAGTPVKKCKLWGFRSGTIYLTPGDAGGYGEFTLQVKKYQINFPESRTSVINIFDTDFTNLHRF